MLPDRFHRPLGHDLTAESAGPGSEVDDVIRSHDRLGVVLHHDHRVPQVAQPAQGAEEALVVALVEPDAGLVENVEHAHQPRSDLGREPDALGLASRERGRATPEREIVESHVSQEAEPVAHLLEDRPGHLRVQTWATVGAEWNRLEELQRALHRQVHDVPDAPAVHQDRQALGLEPLAAAGLAGLLHHELLQRGAHGIAGGLAVAALHVLENALPLALVLTPSAGAVRLEAEAARRPEQQRAPGRFRMGRPGSLDIELERLGESGQHHLPQVTGRLAPRENHALEDGDAGVAQDELAVDLAPGADAVAVGTGSEGRVEGELPRLQLGERETAHRTGEALREHHAPFRSVMPYDLDQPVSGLERRLDRVVEPPAVGGTNHQPIHHHRDIVVLSPVQRGHRTEVVGCAVHADTDESALPHVLEQLAELALSPPHHRGEHLDPSLRRPAEHGLGDLRGALPRDRRAVVGAVRHPDPRPEETEVVVDLGDGADGGSGVLPRALLLDRDGRREPLDRVHIRLFHQAEELPRVGRQRFDVSPLPLGVDGVEGERRLPRAGQPGDHGQLVAGDGDGDVLEVVLASAPHQQIVLRHSPERYPKLLPRVNGFPFRASVSTIYLPS